MKTIDWTKWSAIAEILSAVAIVITLLYLANQTNELRVQSTQNNQLLQIQTELAQAEERRSWDSSIIGNPELAELLVKAQSNANLSEVEEFRLSRIVQMFLSQQEATFNLIEAGAIRDDGTLELGMRRMFEGTGFFVPEEIVLRAWEASSSIRGAAFVRFVETEVRRGDQ